MMASYLRLRDAEVCARCMHSRVTMHEDGIYIYIYKDYIICIYLSDAEGPAAHELDALVDADLAAQVGVVHLPAEFKMHAELMCISTFYYSPTPRAGADPLQKRHINIIYFNIVYFKTFYNPTPQAGADPLRAVAGTREGGEESGRPGRACREMF